MLQVIILPGFVRSWYNIYQDLPDEIKQNDEIAVAIKKIARGQAIDQEQ